MVQDGRRIALPLLHVATVLFWHAGSWKCAQNAFTIWWNLGPSAQDNTNNDRLPLLAMLSIGTIGLPLAMRHDVVVIALFVASSLCYWP